MRSHLTTCVMSHVNVTTTTTKPIVTFGSVILHRFRGKTGSGLTLIRVHLANVFNLGFA
jgi:hypothetical protein